jgi:hypothetical protein
MRCSRLGSSSAEKRRRKRKLRVCFRSQYLTISHINRRKNGLFSVPSAIPRYFEDSNFFAVLKFFPNRGSLVAHSLRVMPGYCPKSVAKLCANKIFSMRYRLLLPDSYEKLALQEMRATILQNICSFDWNTPLPFSMYRSGIRFRSSSF